VDERATDIEELAALWRHRDPDSPASDAVHATLREAILSGVLRPGARLGEEELATRFAVSRTPVREAILRLEVEHLAERRSRRGLVVATISPHEILDLYVVRQAIDSHAAYLAAQQASPLERQRLERLHERMVMTHASGDVSELAHLNLQFHELIGQAAHSPLLMQFLAEVHHRVRRFTTTTFAYGDRAAAALDEHRRLIDAINARDAEQAHDIAYAHMGHALDVRIAMEENQAAASVYGDGGGSDARE
jgi:DNA-binding GntR family transcriptional regulator